MEKVTFEEIVFGFEDPSGIELVVFNGVSLVLNSNRVYRLLGENGSGKTSFFKLLRGIYRPQSGLIEIPEGLKIFASDYESLPYDIKVKDYLSFYLRAPKEVIELLSLKAVLNLKISSLSTGEKQRLSLTPLFSNFYDLLILDECFKYIDAKHRAKIASAIEEKYAGRSTIIYVEHEAQDLLKTTDYLTIEDKKIKSRMLHHELIIPSNKVSKTSSHKGGWFSPVFRSYAWVYSLLFIFLLMIQLAPSIALAATAKKPYLYGLPAITLKSRDGVFSDSLKDELSAFNKIGYSLEYAYKENDYFAFVANSELDDLSCYTNHFNTMDITYETMFSFSTRGAYDQYLLVSEGPLLTRKPHSFSSPNLAIMELSRSNYIDMMKLFNFFRRFKFSINRSSTFIGTSNYFYISKKSSKPIGGIGIKEESMDNAFVLIDKEKRDIRRFPIGKFDPNLNESFYSQAYDVVLSFDLISQLVDDGSHLSFEITSNQEYKSIKRIADRHGLFTITNYEQGTPFERQVFFIESITFSLTCIISMSSLIFLLGIEKRRFERLIKDSVKIKRGYILSLIFMTTTIISSIFTSVFLSPWFLLFIPICAVLIGIFLLYLRWSVVKHEKI